LAYFVQAIALLAIAGIASAADFSHRVHLAMKLECATCHTTAATSTRAEDNNLPSRQVCLRCHQDAAIKQPTPTAVAHFNHQLHVKMRPCTGCHRGLEKSDVTSKANFPVMAECMGCHRTFDIPDSCWKCHAQTMRLLPADHVTDFLDSHSRVKHSAAEKQSCEVCHGNNFHCAGCH
jgi:predicted CXXCH cytochrome family protein